MPCVVSTLVKTMFNPTWKLVFSIQHVEPNITLQYLWHSGTFGWELVVSHTTPSMFNELFVHSQM